MKVKETTSIEFEYDIKEFVGPKLVVVNIAGDRDFFGYRSNESLDWTFILKQKYFRNRRAREKGLNWIADPVRLPRNSPYIYRALSKQYLDHYRFRSNWMYDEDKPYEIDAVAAIKAGKLDQVVQDSSHEDGFIYSLDGKPLTRSIHISVVEMSHNLNKVREQCAKYPYITLTDQPYCPGNGVGLWLKCDVDDKMFMRFYKEYQKSKKNSRYFGLDEQMSKEIGLCDCHHTDEYFREDDY